MADPIEIPEPDRRPKEEVEAQERVSLVQAIRDEIRLQNKVSKTKNLSVIDKRAAFMISMALQNILKRWVDREEIGFGKSEDDQWEFHTVRKGKE